MKKIILLVVAVLAFYACENDQAKKTKSAELEEIKKDETASNRLANTEFMGELPCDDCDVIHFKIAFDQEKYFLKYAFQGVEREGHFEEGKYEFVDGILTLQSFEEDNIWKLEYSEEAIYLLDFTKKGLLKNHEEKYKLLKY